MQYAPSVGRNLTISARGGPNEILVDKSVCRYVRLAIPLCLSVCHASQCSSKQIALETQNVYCI